MRCVFVLPLLAACAANLADSLEPDAGDVHAKLGAAHGVENEHVEYEMKLAGVSVGRFQIAVGSRGVVDGRPSVIVHSRASLTDAGTLLGSVDWELTTTVDIDSGFAIAETEQVTIDAAMHEGHHESTKTWTVAERHHNVHSAAGALRGWFSGPGAQDTLDVAVLDTVVPVTIADAAREMVGNTPAARYDGLVRGTRPFSVWVSNDTARVPIKLRYDSKIGPIDVDLVDYNVP